jgi:RES domain-containing protein
MRLWRISRYPLLDGAGGMIASNRWHTAPRRIIYCADHPSTALLEVLVHLEVDFDDLPKDYQLIEIEMPEPSRMISITSDWDMLRRDEITYSRYYGNDWFDEKRSLLLSVQSVVLPAARIFLLNVEHPEFSDVSTISVKQISFDPRLWKAN